AMTRILSWWKCVVDSPGRVPLAQFLASRSRPSPSERAGEGPPLPEDRRQPSRGAAPRAGGHASIEDIPSTLPVRKIGTSDEVVRMGESADTLARVEPTRPAGGRR